MFTARYALSPYIKQMGFVFKGLIYTITIVHQLVFISPRKQHVCI
jgi:hypothetical protein